MNFYIPKTKYQLIDLLCLTWPSDRNRLARMTKKQLYAILFRIRKEL